MLLLTLWRCHRGPCSLSQRFTGVHSDTGITEGEAITAETQRAVAAECRCYKRGTNTVAAECRCYKHGLLALGVAQTTQTNSPDEGAMAIISSVIKADDFDYD